MGLVERRMTGWIGLVAGAVLVGANLVHPRGGTDIYESGVAFAEHTDDFWLVLHFVIAVALIPVPLVVHAWWRGLDAPVARVLGRGALMVAVMGAVMGVVHLAGIDGTALPSMRDALARGEADALGAAVLLRVHLATFVSWVLLTFGVGQMLLGLAELLEGRGNKVFGWVLLAGAALGFGSAFGSGAEGHITTATDSYLLRPSAAVLTVWLLMVSWRLMREREPAAR